MLIFNDRTALTKTIRKSISFSNVLVNSPFPNDVQVDSPLPNEIDRNDKDEIVEEGDMQQLVKKELKELKKDLEDHFILLEKKLLVIVQENKIMIH